MQSVYQTAIQTFVATVGIAVILGVLVVIGRLIKSITKRTTKNIRLSTDIKDKTLNRRLHRISAALLGVVFVLSIILILYFRI